MTINDLNQLAIIENSDFITEFTVCKCCDIAKDNTNLFCDSCVRCNDTFFDVDNFVLYANKTNEVGLDYISPKGTQTICFSKFDNAVCVFDIIAKINAINGIITLNELTSLHQIYEHLKDYVL
jgi:hypothetical protein